MLNCKLLILQNVVAVTFAILVSNLARAQPTKGESIDVSVGFGISAPYDEVDVFGEGFFAQGEYAIGLTRWVGVKPYAGLLLTYDGNDENQQAYSVTTKAFLTGGKIRIAAPIPWVAPFLEVGAGASIGSFRTFTPATHLDVKGLKLHIPFTMGLALGREHGVEFGFAYFFHPAAEQFAGAMAVGLSFPVNQ